ncbi:class I SAM-dependent methyltransferase [Rhizobium cauense]|uniref:class I SAM-dependent methyltransferase n=1 Tax=Rhizobium cauense TaxID=1166683 RepID=UPI001C6E9C5C|nr:class I SAM-dependent methyltransferase [Rhizobium cauense]MBW9118305.1 class I SAM-dependent methyltransferase [Rhizobium cauense]
MSEKVDFDKYTDNYNELLRESTGFFTSNEDYFAEYKVRLTRKKVKHQVARILEYGCGIGRNIPYLQAMFPDAEVFGTDISAASLELAAAENRAATFAVETPELEIGQFDLIFIAGVFHHIAPVERPAVCDLLSKRLVRSGTMTVFEHNPYNPITRSIVNTCPFDADAVLLRPSELAARFSQVNMSVVDRSFCLFVPPRLSSLVKLEDYFWWLPLGGQYCSVVRHAK